MSSLGLNESFESSATSVLDVGRFLGLIELQVVCIMVEG
jgi:hypothetical protein